jgi:hypothetical protein
VYAKGKDRKISGVKLPDLVFEIVSTTSLRKTGERAARFGTAVCVACLLSTSTARGCSGGRAIAARGRR